VCKAVDNDKEKGSNKERGKMMELDLYTGIGGSKKQNPSLAF
jgi:hypothetical protein